MAIAFDAAGGVSNYSTGGNVFNHTCTGSNLLLLVGVTNEDTGSVTGVTYNGVAMTQLGTTLAYNGNREINYWYLLAPATGTHAVALTATGNIFGCCSSASYTGVSQAGFPDSTGSATGNNTNPGPANVTTVADNSWSTMFYGGDVASTISSNTNCTNRDFHANTTSNAAIGDTNAVVHPAGSINQSITMNASGKWAITYSSFAPAPVVIVNGNFLTFM